MYEHHGHPHFYIRSVFDNKVLTADGHKAGSKVIVHHREHPPKQKQLWRFETFGGDHFVIVSALDPNLVVEVNPAHNSVVVNHRHHPPIPKQIFEWHGGHLIRTHLNEDLVLEIKHHSTSDHAKVDVSVNHGGDSQRWEVDRAEYFE